MLIPRHSDVYERVNSEARNGRKWYEKICCTKNPAPANRMFLSDTASERNSESLVLFLFHVTEFRVVFSSAEWFWTEFLELASIFVPRTGIQGFDSAEGFGTKFREFASIFVPQNGIPSSFLFRGRVRNGIPRVSVPRNSRNSVGNNQLFRLFRLPRNYFLSEIANPNPKSNWKMWIKREWLQLGG